MKIELGDIARDRLTGFEGVVVASTEWLYGCRRLTIQPQTLKDGKPLDTATFDEPQVELVGEKFERYADENATAPANKAATSGGPRPEPERGR